MKSSVLQGNRITTFTAVFVTGFAGIIAQIILLRELMVSVYGNELSIGIILANWLILEACGWFGGILGGVILLPVMGLLGTCLTVTMLKLCSTLLVRKSL